MCPEKWKKTNPKFCSSWVEDRIFVVPECRRYLIVKDKYRKVGQEPFSERNFTSISATPAK